MNPLFLVLLLLLLGLLIVLLVVLARLYRALRYSRTENDQLRSILQLSSSRAQNDLKSLRQLRHDLRHYLRVAQMPLSDSLLYSEPQDQAAPPQNWVLSSLEDYYRQRAEHLGFQVDLRLELIPTREELLPDLCLLLSNLLENAVEALQREGSGWLRARSHSTPGYLSLVVVNSSSQKLHIRNGHYLSSKREGRYGIGLSTALDIARRYGGSAEFSADGKEFRASVFLPWSASPQPPKPSFSSVK